MSVLTIVDAHPLIITLLLFAVMEIVPPLADAGGGTQVVIHGEVRGPPAPAPSRPVVLRWSARLFC